MNLNNEMVHSPTTSQGLPPKDLLLLHYKHSTCVSVQKLIDLGGRGEGIV